MSDKLSSRPPGPPTVFADDTSVVMTRELKDVKGKGLLMKTEGVSDPGTGSSGIVNGQFPQKDYIACSGSVICADKLSGVTVEGVIDLSVTMNPPKVRQETGTVDEARPSSKEPAVKMITEHKVEFIKCLMVDHSFILQHVHARRIVTDREYQNMKHISQPEETVTKLIDHVIFKGQESSSLFLDILKEPDVVCTYPQLVKITRKLC